jgi:hypothetical protein
MKTAYEPRLRSHPALRGLCYSSGRGGLARITSDHALTIAAHPSCTITGPQISMLGRLSTRLVVFILLCHGRPHNLQRALT